MMKSIALYVLSFFIQNFSWTLYDLSMLRVKTGKRMQLGSSPLSKDLSSVSTSTLKYPPVVKMYP